jgi:hypothetical protein
VVTLPDGKTKTIGISQGTQKRYWFGVCPVSSKIGNLKMCGGCKMVGYVGKEEQVFYIDSIQFTSAPFYARMKLPFAERRLANAQKYMQGFAEDS